MCLLFKAQLPSLPDHNPEVPKGELLWLQRATVLPADRCGLRCLLCERLCHPGDLHDGRDQGGVPTAGEVKEGEEPSSLVQASQPQCGETGQAC